MKKILITTLTMVLISFIFAANSYAQISGGIIPSGTVETYKNSNGYDAGVALRDDAPSEPSTPSEPTEPTEVTFDGAQYFEGAPVPDGYEVVYDQEQNAFLRSESTGGEISNGGSSGESGENIFRQIIAKSSKVLITARNISFVISGFGLIVFAWGAIFNKISWKLFFSIAIGLFLLASMGAFISFFITQEGQSTHQLEYGDTMKNTFDDTMGTNGNIN